MASRGFGQSYTRISAADMIRRTPIVPYVSERIVRVSTGGCFFAFCILLTYIVARVIGIWSIALLLPASAWMSACLIDWINGAFLTEGIHQFIRSIWLRPPIVYEAKRERSSIASGVIARSLVCLEKDYKQLVREYRSVHGRSAESPDVPYRLVIASYKLNGNERVVALSDGTSATWHRASATIIAELEHSWWRADRPDETGAASALNELIRIIHEEGSERGIQDVRSHLSVHSAADIDRALDAALWWRLIREDIHLAVHLTEAGRHWHLATADAESARDKERKKMQNSSGGGPQFNIDNLSGVFYYAGHNISGEHSHRINNSQYSDDRIIACLKEILHSTAIPWSDPDLVGVREIIEGAVAQRNPRASGLKQAVVKLKEICEQVAVGMLGNGAYQLLVQHFL